MKKLLCILLTVCLLFALAACSSEKTLGSDKPAQSDTPGQSDTADAPGVDTPDVGTAAGEGFVFNYNGTEIAMNVPAADILAALGEPKNYTEEASCAFEGLDKTYYFGSFYLQTYPAADGDYTYCLWFVDDTVTTAEGLYIGAPEAQVKTAMGEDSYNGSNAYIVTKGDSKLTVMIENGVVSNITYDAVVL